MNVNVTYFRPKLWGNISARTEQYVLWNMIKHLQSTRHKLILITNNEQTDIYNCKLSYLQETANAVSFGTHEVLGTD